MNIHPEGKATIRVVGIFLIVTLVLVFVFVDNWVLQGIALVAGIAFFAFILHFFRNPHRVPVQKDGYVISPADGTIVSIEETHEPEYFKKPMLLVSIFMSPLNVHRNWTPIAGEVAYYKYHTGKYLVASHPKSSTLNERTTIVYKGNGHEVMARQIAGYVARRIVCYHHQGQQLPQGGDMGFIKFGSRIDLYLPIGSQVLVKMGDTPVGSQTPIAKLPEA